MTTAQLDHLKRIDAHLDKLLAIAANRTDGRWKHSANYLIGGWWVQDKLAEQREGYVADFCKEEDAAYIASCAGNAEAGWKATRAFIKVWTTLRDSLVVGVHPIELWDMCNSQLEVICECFPLELLDA